LAGRLGVNRIYLVGVDMQLVDDQKVDFTVRMATENTVFENLLRRPAI
jgi:hypothetical protein